MAKDKASSLAIDFSKFTDEDLEAYEKGETSALSDNALEALANYEDKFNEMASKVGKYKEPEAAPYGLTTAASGTVGALATGIAPRTSQQLVDKMLPEDLRGGYKAPPAAAPVMTKPPVAPAPGADYFSPFGAGEGAVKNATHNVDEVLKNKVAQAAIKTPGYVAPGNSLILQPSSNLPPPTAPVATPGSPVLPGAVKPKMGMPQMRAALQSPNVMPANRLPSSIKGGAAAGFGANAIENAQRGNYGEAATSAIGSGSSLAALASNPKLARAGKLGMAATILGKGYQSMQGREEKAMGGLVGYANGNVVKKAGVAAKKAMSNLDLGKKIPESSFTASPEQTVSNPLRNAFPGIYKRPDVIAREASERVAPESPALKQLFGVTRDDLYQMGKGRTGNMPGMLPGAAANPKGSKAATAVMNPRNEQRLLDVLGEAEKYPELVRGMDPWYIMDPAYKRLEELVGPEEAMRKYKQFNTMTGMASPGSDVLTEMNRGTAANFLATQGRFDDFLKYGGKGFNPEAPADIQNILGHPYHMTAQGKPMKQYLDTGEIQMSSPKVPMYIDASGVTKELLSNSLMRIIFVD
jgi:hypothetical protein